MASWNLYDTWRDFRLDDTNAAVTGTLKVALVLTAYTPDQNLHDFFDDITNEVTGTNYTAGGNAAATPTYTLSGAGLITFDAADPATWAQNAGGFTAARRAILYYDTGTPATSRLVAYSDDFGSDKGNVSGDFSIAMDAAGIYTNAR